MELFTREVSPKGKISYKPVDYNSLKPGTALTDGEIISAVGGLAVCAIYGYGQLVKPKSCTANRIKSVQETVLKMFADTGSKIEASSVAHVCRVWDVVTMIIQGAPPECD